MTTTLRRATAGVLRATLWVFDANAPSIAFYHRQGWAEDGTTRTTPEFGELERRLVKDLQPAGVGATRE
jgi:hypothetical protein